MEAKLDEKGRVVLPEKIRKKLGLHQSSRIRMEVEPRGVVIMRATSPEEFIRTMEGFIPKAFPKRNPIFLKKIWEKT